MKYKIYDVADLIAVLQKLEGTAQVFFQSGGSTDYVQYAEFYESVIDPDGLTTEGLVLS